MENWCPILPSVLLQHKDVLQVLIQDKDVVVWRSESGRVQIWQNRCPHRSVRLSLGRVVGEHLACAYHGWEFSAEDGSCQKIPAQPQQRAPKSICSTTYPVAEQAGMIWFGGFDGCGTPLQIADHQAKGYYAGSIQVNQNLATVIEFLKQQDFVITQAFEMQGQQQGIRIYLSPIAMHKTTVHAFNDQPQQGIATLNQFFNFRQQLERCKDEHYA